MYIACRDRENVFVNVMLDYVGLWMAGWRQVDDCWCIDGVLMVY